MDDDDESNINRTIDRCHCNLTHFDIARIVHKIFKSHYRYIGKKKWEYLDIQDNTWKLDHNKNKLKSDIKNIVSDMFLKRSLHWLSLSQLYTDINQQIQANIMYEKLVFASYKLKNYNFISTVIKEAIPFFDIHNDD